MSEGSIINSDNVSFLDKELENSIERSLNWLLSKQKGDGHWAFELEADATIPSEYIFLNHFLKIHEVLLHICREEISNSI